MRVTNDNSALGDWVWEGEAPVIARILTIKGGLSEIWDENFTKVLKHYPYTPKAFLLSFINLQ